MKSLLLLSLFIISSQPTFAKFDQAIIRSIDDIETERNYVEVSEEGLPQNHYLLLLEKINAFRFTLLQDSLVNAHFSVLKKNPMARMRSPGGQCSYRRAYIQNYLKKRGAITGKLLIKCPANNGRLRLRDQVTGHYYNFANFHDVNIMAVQANGGADFRVMDVQFKDRPVSLHEYLTEIEASQKIRPLKLRDARKGFCYWSISTNYFSL